MSGQSKKASIPLTPSKSEMSFICRIGEGRRQTGVLKVPSAFAAFCASLNLNVIGLHLPIKKTWLGRYVSSSQTIEGLESLMEYFDVNPWFSFTFEYMGGTEFSVEIFSEYAVEIDYSRIRSGAVARDAVFELSEIEKEKLCSTYSHSAASEFDREFDFVITQQHLGGNRWTEMFSTEDAMEIGLDPEMQFVELGFQKIVWKINLKWTGNTVLFGKEWNYLTKGCMLRIGYTCFIIGTAAEQRFELAIFHKDQSTNIYKQGDLEGKGFLKWFKVLHWMNLLTGELEIPFAFGQKYASGFKNYGQIYLADGMVYTCYLSKSANLVFGLKELLQRYGVHPKSTMFFEYLGESKFYASIYNEEGAALFNELPSKLLLSSFVQYLKADFYVISDSEEEEGHLAGKEAAGNSGGLEHTSETNGHPDNSAQTYEFTMELLKSHVDQNNHGVFLPRFLHALYKKWNKKTVVTLIMNSQSYKMAILRRKKTCRLGVGWNAFTMQNKLYEGQKVVFTYTGNATFQVRESV